jgi:hypothetical protein
MYFGVIHHEYTVLPRKWVHSRQLNNKQYSVIQFKLVTHPITIYIKNAHQNFLEEVLKIESFDGSRLSNYSQDPIK